MTVKINQPNNLTQFQLNKPVNFNGTAEGNVVKVKLFAEQYKLSEFDVIDGSWSISYSFNRAGKRRIIAQGFDAANNQVDTHEIDILVIESNMPVLGIDVSNHNPPINWQTVKNSKILFAIAKATEGATYQDPTFMRNWLGMKEVGIIRGAYHFFRPLKNPQEQVDNFISLVKFKPGDLPPVLDVEAWPEKVGEQWKSITISQRIASVKAWLDKVEEETGKKPVIYTSPSFWEEYMDNTQDFTDHPLWIAHYTSKAQPNVPANNWGGKGYTFWQHTESGTVNGVSGKVDRNRFKGSLENLIALVS
ncbi:glycoside hydrolase family 25 protein [Anabaena sp. UHCC 0253]|uniref:glycoside hydrolase family 25 protein n=1 Tax=Anabaena sp. UHCC 0253 TaxID=2590019 RepID=UPI00144645E0|nr:glycoside hydrolase family 25 protein [Anabaena sp. UHCC 0253]MTJ55957.1 glycoside hydrolase family 25 protein [Anabaena sp. UHCC 0253]